MNRVFIVLLLNSALLFAGKQNLIYYQFLGPSGIYSVNYERVLPVKINKLQMSVGLGLSMYNETIVDLPLTIRTFLGDHHQLVIGGGFEPEWYIRNDVYDYQSILIGNVGYRHIFENGIMLGFEFTPIYELTNKFSYPTVGLSFGYNM